MSKLLCVILCFACIATGRLAYGQESAPVPQSYLGEMEIKELKTWLAAEAKWQQWHEKWGHRAIVEQRIRTESPAWLAPQCSQLMGGEGVLVDACDALKEIREGTGSRRSVIFRITDSPERTSFLERIHVGGGWPLVMGPKLFKYQAILEIHASFVRVGRIQLNLPGVIVVSVPDEKGERVLKVGATTGISIRLHDFQVMGTKKRYTLHANMSNAFIREGAVKNASYPRLLSLAGLSVTVKK